MASPTRRRSPRCIELLDHAKAILNSGPFVCPGRTSDVLLSNIVFLMLLRRLGHDHITAHGFRSAFRDGAAERTNFARAVCEAASAHVLKDKAEASYFRSDLFDQRRRRMKPWSVFATTKLAKVFAFPLETARAAAPRRRPRARASPASACWGNAVSSAIVQSGGGSCRGESLSVTALASL